MPIPQSGSLTVALWRAIVRHADPSDHWQKAATSGFFGGITTYGWLQENVTSGLGAERLQQRWKVVRNVAGLRT
ncbi:MAG: hypothetical protein ACKO2P_06390 [Planctomycetota bacterium]